MDFQENTRFLDFLCVKASPKIFFIHKIKDDADTLFWYIVAFS